MENYSPLAAEICWRVWGIPANIEGFRVLAALWHSSSARQPKFTALDRGRHLHSAGRPSRWALAHILVILWFAGTEQQQIIKTALINGSQITCIISNNETRMMWQWPWPVVYPFRWWHPQCWQKPCISASVNEVCHDFDYVTAWKQHNLHATAVDNCDTTSTCHDSIAKSLHSDGRR